MRLIECIMTQSTCYRKTTKGHPVGVLWHDTGAGNPYIWRYVQPSDNDPNRDELLKIIGKNPNANDWNHTEREAGVHFFIGRLADGSIGTVQTLPLDYRPWGCGSGRYGSCNGSPSVSNSPFWIQFEICDDSCNSKTGKYDHGSGEYWQACMKEAAELTMWLCKKYGFGVTDKYTWKGVPMPVVTCHYESYLYGLGSDHGDVVWWGRRYEDTFNVNSVRNIVRNRIEEEIDMTKEELNQLLETKLNERDRQLAQKLSEAVNGCKDYSDKRLVEVNGKYIHEIGEVHKSLQPMTRKLLDCGAINGGTTEEVNPDDINLPLNDLRSILVAGRYAEYLIRELLEDTPPEDYDEKPEEV